MKGEQRSIQAPVQDNCADGCHVYRRGVGGFMVCRCGAVIPHQYASYMAYLMVRASK